ncbi:MAG: DUF2892 domain-containing protein [Nitrospira sp.]|nr:DUF2892 domain-containing protein [bacterium]MBL7031633.1 DUF2892 domain-containing protein [Nitrospira sp.]
MAEKNCCNISKTLSIVMGSILLAVALLFPFVNTVIGKAVISLVGIILIGLGVFRSCPLGESSSCGIDKKPQG